MNRIFQILLYNILMLLPVGMTAQQQSQQPQASAYNRKTVLREVRANLKASKYAQVDDQIQKVTQATTEARNDAELNYMMLLAQNGLATAENRNIFLKNRPDTAKYFNYIYKVYQYGILCDSLDRVPNEKGRAKTHYTSSVASMMLSYRNNIKSAGKFFYKKQKYADAYRFFDMYLKTRNHTTLLSSKNYSPDSDTTDIALMAVYSAYSAQDYLHTVEYLPIAMSDTTDYSYLCQIGSMAYLAMKDTLNAVDYMFEGWKYEPTNEYFFATLVDYYINQHKYQNAHDIISAQLDEESDNHRLWYILGKCQQCMDSIDAAVTSYEHAISLNKEDALSYSSLGNIFIEKARQIYNINTYDVGTREYADTKQHQDHFYISALMNLENARRYAPENTSLWLAPLSEVYYKLNMGKELKALESLK